MLGQREPDIYGTTTLNDIERICHKKAETLGLHLECFQSNYEGALVEKIHTAITHNIDAIVINPGAYSHTSIALRDALSMFKGIIIEVHLSNIHAREKFRHNSYISAIAKGVVCGLGIQGYVYALDTIDEYLLST